MREWIGEPDYIERRIAGRFWVGRMRRKRQKETDKESAEVERPGRPASKIDAPQDGLPRTRLAAAPDRGLAWVDRLDHEVGQQSSDAVMYTLGYV